MIQGCEGHSAPSANPLQSRTGLSYQVQNSYLIACVPPASSFVSSRILCRRGRLHSCRRLICGFPARHLGSSARGGACRNRGVRLGRACAAGCLLLLLLLGLRGTERGLLGRRALCRCRRGPGRGGGGRGGCCRHVVGRHAACAHHQRRGPAVIRPRRARPIRRSVVRQSRQQKTIIRNMQMCCMPEYCQQISCTSFLPAVFCTPATKHTAQPGW